ncbi:RNA 2'-phosphotransferase [Streptomyces roseirectus]|uniref:Probable RNA 2'-phosphotransferase n=1 Tax=Streptomyces roseirectus TaxID=2768066 RepID=A0A7H0IFU8_9ACTN|nr:RNA 2'-phosphotransferase [Streptomyces roseirectus]QNP71664.1 RNA 2'-phosphotransferase [Streptomyces roseirectus]
MTDQRTVRVSKYLSKHLRHQPDRIGLRLDEAGWTEIDALLTAAATHGFRITRDELDHVVATNDKKRFEIAGTRIRASQGHSIDVDLDLPPATPPPRLYHGTNPRALPSIRTEGLRAMNRHDVHLSPDLATATRVGARRGRPVILTVDSAAMHRDGHVFHVSANGVWLTKAVPARYIRFGEAR